MAVHAVIANKLVKWNKKNSMQKGVKEMEEKGNKG